MPNGEPVVERASSPRSVWLIAVAIIGWAFLVRLPFGFAPRSDADAALFWLIGHGWREGHLPYVALWDVKPPGIFLIFAGADAMFGADPLGGRSLAALAIGIGAVGLYRIGDRLVGDWRVGAFAAFLFPAQTLLLEGLANKPELFAAPFVIWAILIAVEAGRALVPLLVAGFLMGAAAMLKQTAGFEILFLISLVATTQRHIGACLAFVAGLLVVPAGFALYFAAMGAFAPLVDASLIGALTRLHGDGITLAEAPTRLLASLKPVMPLLILTGLAFTERRRIPWTGHRAGPLILWGWLAFAAFGELAMRATYPAYALPLLAPLSLLSARLLAALAKAGGQLAGWTARGLFVLSLLCPILQAAVSPDPDIDRQSPQVAAFLRQHLPGQTAYVVDYDPVVYQLSGAPMPTRFPFPQHLMCDFPALPVRPFDEFRHIMATHPAALIFAPSGHRMICEMPARVDFVEILASRSGYRRTASIDGPAGAVEIWTDPAHGKIQHLQAVPH